MVLSVLIGSLLSVLQFTNKVSLVYERTHLVKCEFFFIKVMDTITQYKPTVYIHPNLGEERSSV